MDEMSISQSNLHNLQLANAIFSELGVDEVLEDEEKIYTDVLYISIISYIVPENSFNIQPGNDKDEMFQNLNKLVEFLSSIVEIDLNHIDTKSIIYDQDVESAKHLLQLVLELILVLKKEQMNNEGEDGEEGEIEQEAHGHQDSHTDEPSQMSDFQSMDRIKKSSRQGEISEDYLKGKESEDGPLSNSQADYQNNYRLSSDNKSDRINGNSLKHSGIKPSEPNYENHLSSKRSGAGSEESVQYVYNAQKSCPDFIYENPDQSDNSIQKYNLKPNYTQSDLSRYLYEQNLIQLFQQQQEEEKAQNEEFANFQEKPDKSKSINISRISEVSHSKENSDQQAGKNYSKNRKEENLKKSASNSESQNPSKLISSWKQHNDYDINNLGSKKSDKQTESVEIENNSEFKDHSLHQNDLVNSISFIKTGKSKRNSEGSSSQVYKKGGEKSQSISQKSQKQNNAVKVHNNKANDDYDEDEEKRLKKIKSQKQLIEEQKKEKKASVTTKKEERKNSNAPSSKPMKNTSVNANKSKSYSKSISRQSKDKSNVELSMSSINSIYKQSDYNKGETEQQPSPIKLPEQVETDEIPLDNEALKSKLVKDIKRIYGSKYDKLFLKEISSNKGLLENIVKTFKLAKEKMAKVGSDTRDCDEIITKECLEKIRKQYDYIIKYYGEEQKKRNYFRQKCLQNITKNNEVLKKVQKIENDKIKEEIDRKRKARELKNRDQQIKFCKDVYAKTVELEKQKLIEDKQIADELRMQENVERRLIFEQIENYYKDKISMLKEILHREKYEREIEYRAHIQYFSKLQRENKKEQREKISQMFNRLDEEDRNYEVKVANADNFSELISNYYKYS